MENSRKELICNNFGADDMEEVPSWVPLFYTSFKRSGNRRAFRLGGQGPPAMDGGTVALSNLPPKHRAYPCNLNRGRIASSDHKRLEGSTALQGCGQQA